MSSLVGTYVTFKNKRLFIEKKLGEGAFGEVYKVRDGENKESLALKIIPCHGPAPNNVLREAKTLFKVKHPRVVQILGADYLPGVSFRILTEFCAGGDLNTRLNERSSNDTNLKWIYQISEALDYLHSRRPAIVHRDLKADNVLLTDNATKNLKLGDFGLAREYRALKNIDESSSSAIETYYMTSGIGPIHWMAPEFYDQHYTEKADIFSLAGIFYAILARDYIWRGSKKMYGVFVKHWSHGKVGLGLAMAKIDKDFKVQFPASFQGSNSMKYLIQDMLTYQPNQRPSANDVYERVKDMRSSSVQNQQIVPANAGSCC